MRGFKSVVFLSILNLFAITFANDSKWQYSFDGGLKISLSTFTNNWNGNNSGTFVWESDIESGIHRKFSKWFENEEILNISYGQTSVQDKNTKHWSSLEKSSDEINLQSINKTTLGKILNPCIAFQLNTQFTDDEEENNLRYFNPLEITESFGITRGFKNNMGVSFNFRISGALRQKINRNSELLVNTMNFDIPGNDSTNTESDPTELVTYHTVMIKDGGTELVADFKWKHVNRFTLSSKSTIFKAFIRTNPNNPPVNDFWKYPDIKWETMFSANITSFLQFTYYFLFNYDREIDMKPRFKQTLGLGLSLSFSN